MKKFIWHVFFLLIYHPIISGEIQPRTYLNIADPQRYSTENPDNPGFRRIIVPGELLHHDETAVCFVSLFAVKKNIKKMIDNSAVYASLSINR